MGSIQEMVQSSATVAHSEIFWGENCYVFLLDWLLFENADSSSDW
jgi:hypothetical protein